MRGAQRGKVNILQMKCLKSLVGVSRMDRVSDEEMRRGAGKLARKGIVSRADQGADSQTRLTASTYLSVTLCNISCASEVINCNAQNYLSWS